LAWQGGEVVIGDHDVDGGVGSVTASIRQSLLDVQYGRAADSRGWLTRLV
jgi:branched-chain amino acid aminotransferase